MSIDIVARTPGDIAGEERQRATTSVQSARPGHGDATPVASLQRDVAALHVADVQHNPLQPDVSYRGFTLSPLLGTAQGLSIYVDGVRLNDPFGDTANWATLPPAAIERVDLIAGANPSFGLNTLGGAIVLRTKRGGDDIDTIDVSGGSFGNAHGAISIGQSRDGRQWFLAGDHIRDDGWRDHSPSRATRGFATFGWTGERMATDIRGSMSHSVLTGNGPAPVQLLATDRAAVFTHPDETHSTSAFASARSTWMLSSTALLQTTVFARQAVVSTLNGDESPFEAYQAVNNRTRARQQSAGFTVERDAESQSHQWLGGVAVDAARTRFAMAIEPAAFDETRGTVGEGFELEEGRVDLRSTLFTAAIYASDRWSVTPRFDLTFAARYNHAQVELDDRIGGDLDGSHRFGHLNLSAGFHRQLSRSLSLFGSGGRSTRVPSPVELTCADPEAPCRLPNAFVSDPPLVPVRTTSFEMGVRGNAPVRWSAAAFHARSDDDILFVASGRVRGEGHFENVGTTTRRGIEIAAGSSLWRASYALIDARYGERFAVANPHHPDAAEEVIVVESGDVIPLTPRHLVKAGLTLRFGRSSVALDARYTSSQFVRGDDANLTEPLRDYTVADARLEHDLTTRIRLWLTVANAFDTDYETFGLFGEPDEVLGDEFDDPLFVSPGAPRTIRVGARIRF